MINIYYILISFLISVVKSDLVGSSAFLSDSWMLSSERPSGPRCVQIPTNLSICHGMQYTEMRLPNLLDHENIDEAILAARDWNNLLNLNCHPDTQLFLCSLFAPICLPTMDREILPCRSLCQAVKQGCEGRMSIYGFPWPEMLSCEKYPEDNDMCIRPVNHEKQVRDIKCQACNQIGTYENLVDHFCRSSMVVKTKISKVTGTHITLKGGRSLKKGDRRRNVAETEIRLSLDSTDCPCGINPSEEERFIVMANKADNGFLTANLVLPWKKEKNMKRAVHQFQRLNCKSLGREIRESASRRPHYYAMRRHNTGRFGLF